MRKTFLFPLMLLLQSIGLAAPIPWSQSGKDANDSPKVVTIFEMHEDYGYTINKKDGKPNVYQMNLTNGKRDALGDPGRLGLSTNFDRKSGELNDNNEIDQALKEKGYLGMGKWKFSQEITRADVMGMGGLIGLAILADDTATITVHEVKAGGNVKVGDFTVHGGALWQPDSFGIAPFSLQYGTKYLIEVSFENIVNVKYIEKGEVDVDGISVWMFGASAIHNQWHLVNPSQDLLFWSKGDKLAGKFSGMSGWPEYQMHDPSTYLQQAAANPEQPPMTTQQKSD